MTDRTTSGRQRRASAGPRPRGRWAEAFRQLPTRPVLSVAPPLADLLATVDLPRIAAALQVTEDALVQAVRLLVTGSTVGAVTLDAPAACIRQLGRHLGWSMSWRRPGLRTRSQVGRLTRQEVIHRCQAGESAAVVGRLASVSRERIRQICQQAGLPPRTQELARLRQQRADEASALRQVTRAERERQHAHQRGLRQERLAVWLGPAQDRWCAGAPLREIAEQYRMSSSSLCWWMLRARQRCGPAWFPPRRTADPSVLHQRHADLLRRWRSGEPAAVIARALGCSRGALRSRIAVLRCHLGEDVLPRRTPSV